MPDKAQLRAQARAALKTLSAEAIAESSRAIRERILQQPEWLQAKAVLLYAPLPSEPDVWELFGAAKAANKVVALPRFDSARGVYVPAEADEGALVKGAFGALEPGIGARVINALDFIVVPGLAFDSQGRRLGRGKGFYDRLLSELPVGCVKCGVAFDEQILPEIPTEPHDIGVDCVATPSRWLDCRAIRRSEDGH